MWAHKQDKLSAFCSVEVTWKNTQLERLSRVAQRNSTFECLCGNWIKIELFAMLFYFLSSLFHRISNLLALSLSLLFFSALRCWEISMLYNIQTSRKAAVCWRRESERSDDEAQQRSRRKEKFILENSPVHTIFFIIILFLLPRDRIDILLLFVPCWGSSVGAGRTLDNC